MSGRLNRPDELEFTGVAPLTGYDGNLNRFVGSGGGVSER